MILHNISKLLYPFDSSMYLTENSMYFEHVGFTIVNAVLSGIFPSVTWTVSA